MTTENILRHLRSLLVTFVASFLLVVAFEISSDDFVFSVEALKITTLAGLIAGARAVAKIIYELAYNYLFKKTK